MNEKKFLTPFLLLVLFWILFIMVPLVTYAYEPDWLREHMNGTLRLPHAYHGISFSAFEDKTPDYNVIRMARDRALNELCYRLSVSIKSQFKEKITQIGMYEEQYVSSSIFISTHNRLSGVEEKKKWTDPIKHKYWVMLAIDKAKADRQIEQQAFINEVVDRLENKQDEILKGIQKISVVLTQNLQEYSGRMKHFEYLLETINTKVGAASEQTKETYASIRQEIAWLEQKHKKHQQKLEGSYERQNQKISDLMHQNSEIQKLMRRIYEKIQDDSFLALTDDDISYQLNDSDFKVMIEPEKGQGADYYAGEKVRFRVRASRNCFVKVLYLSTTRHASGSDRIINTLLFPNLHDNKNWIMAGETKIIGMRGELEINPPYGKDVVTVVASGKQFADIAGALKQANHGYYSEVTLNTRGTIQLRTRGIAVAQPASHATLGFNHQLISSNAIATDTCFIVSHPK